MLVDEYLLSTVFLLCIGMRPRAYTWVRAFYYNNINRPDGATYSQTIYVPKYSPRRAWFLRLLEVNVLRSEHLIYHKNH